MQAKYLNEKELKMVCEKVKQILMEEANVHPISGPVIVVGDIKGHFIDLLQIFKIFGPVDQTRYIFLGNYVNRGWMSVETLCLLFCLKIMYPERITLLRGNLEGMTSWRTQRFDLYAECSKKYGNGNAWIFLNEVFDYLPIAAIYGTKVIIKDQIFFVHSGLSPKISSVNQIGVIDRNKFRLQQENQMTDLLWSDPRDIQNWGVSDRGNGWFFGEKAVKKFCYINEFSVIARGNELQKEGYQFWFDESLVTIWSAPNFVGRYGNKASVMQVQEDCSISMKLFESSTLNKKFSWNKNYPFFE